MSKYKRKYTGILIFIISIAILAYFFTRDDEIVRSDPEWNCEYVVNNWQCLVSFEINNKTYTHQIRKMSIRGVKIPANSKYASMETCGEKLFDLDLAPLERLKVSELVEMNRKPNEIKVNIWK